MPETSDFELFNAPAASEKKEVSDEVFREQMHKAQKAMQALQKEEGKAKKNDDSLASVIVRFLSQPANTDLFLLISRAAAQNISSEMIIAVLSLIDQKSFEETKGLLKTIPDLRKSEVKALIRHQERDISSLSPQLKKAIDAWIQVIGKVAHKRPQRTRDSLVTQKGKASIAPIVTQFSSIILRRFLKYHKVNTDFETLKEFMEGVFVELVKNLEFLIKNQRQLSSGEDK